MSLLSILFSLLFIVTLGAGLAGLLLARGERAQVACFLLSMNSLVAILVLLGAHVIAIALLLFSAGLGLFYFFVVSLVAYRVPATENEEGEGSRASTSLSWQRLIVILGIALASAVASLLFDILPARQAASLPVVAASGSFEAVASVLLIHQGIALLGVGLLLLTALIGASALARGGLD